MDKYKISSYKLQDGSWGAAFIPPAQINGMSATISQRTEFGQYFPTKEEADRFTTAYLLHELSVNEAYIEK